MKALLLILTLIGPVISVSGDEQCAMPVLGRYCLGGLASSLPKSKAIQEGDQPGVVVRLFEGGEAVATYNGRIYKVARIYGAADFNTYNQVYGQLVTSYGQEIERLKISHFPPDAKDEVSRLEALLSHKARLQHVWSVPGTALISLSWEGPALGLSYENPLLGPQEAPL